MSKTAVAVAIPLDHYDHPFKALAESTVNMAGLIFDFMYGTPSRATVTYLFALGLSFLGIGMDHAQNMASFRDCQVTSL